MGNEIIRILLLLIVCAWSAHVTADELDVDVTIENLDFRQPKVTVSYDGKSRELDIASDSEIEINGRKTDYRSMLPGDQAKVTYHKERKLVTKIVIQRELMAPAEKLAEGWEEIDPRLIFLMIRLANVEATLEAIEKATEKKGVRVVTVERDAKRADRANEDMDRNAGGPLKWSQFYGTTAEKFFYHPTDRNSSYHTTTVLNQQGSQADNKVGGGVPSSQGLPVHQRPPQFDYIYRANEKARGRAEREIVELRGKLDQLEARRQRLEAEQAGLWVEIAFHSMLHFDLDKNPIYRFEPLMLASDTDSRNKTEILRATTEFMALVLSIIKEADRDQSGTFTRIKPAVAKSRQSMMDTYLRLAVDVTDKKSSLGRFYALAKRIDEVASNLTDSYVVAMEGDSSKDRIRKDLFRLQLQQSVLNYAQIVLAMDEMVKELESDYGYKPNLGCPVKYVAVNSINPVAIIRPIISDPNESHRVASITPNRPKHIHQDAVYNRGKWYWFPNQRGYFNDALKFAAKNKGSLIEINSKEEDDFVRKHIRGPTFLGITKNTRIGWANLKGQPQLYFNWATGQPQNSPGEILVATHPEEPLFLRGWHDYINNEKAFLYLAVQWFDDAR